MPQVIIYTQENGQVAMCVPTGEIPIEDVLAKDCPKGAVIFDTDALPKDDFDFYNAWEYSSGAVLVNLDKAKEITADRLRKEREPLLAKLDVAFQRAIETGADTADIVKEKQRLRDIPKLVTMCTTTAELRDLRVEAK